MSNVNEDLRYTKSHEWVRLMEDESVMVGISDHAQGALGELVFVELPEVDTEISSGDACAVVESVKAASDIYSPINGEIVEANEALADSPELVNQDPYGDGWIMRIRPNDPAELEELLDAEAYTELLQDEA
ncbi:MAG: glycine cleavage system protein GcvH [Pseudomonadota bacterium]